MGAGRKTESYKLPEKLAEKSQPVSIPNFSVTARNLKKSELGGVIFGCKHSTIKECFEKQLFGLPNGHFSYVKNISTGLPLFLFNYSDRKLYGIFEAASTGRWNIDPHCWTEGGSGSTHFPAQVKFKTRMCCQPLLENQFAPIIADNYYGQTFFRFELDQDQTNKLISLFSSSPATPSVYPPGRSITKKSTLVSSSRQTDGVTEKPASDLNVASQKQANIYGGSSVNGIGLSYSSILKNNRGPSYSSVLKNGGHLTHAHTEQSSLDTHGLSAKHGSLSAKDNQEALEHAVEIANLPTDDQFKSTWETTWETTWESHSIRYGLNEQINSSEDVSDDSGRLDEQFECLQQKMEDLYSSVAAEDNSGFPQFVPCETLPTDYAVCEGEHLETRVSEGDTYLPDKPEIENCCLSEADLPSNVELPLDVHFVVDKIQQEVNTLKLKQFKQEQKISSLGKQLVLSRTEIKYLKQQLETSRYISFQETNGVIESESKIDESILIIGGFNGLFDVSALECYCPSRDLLVSLCPMKSTRSYTSTVKLNDEVYVIGGLDDNLWHDIVESYNLVENQWVTRPSLNRKKGSLAGISLNEKVFAIGGGNGVECFSEVEVFDLDIGRWIPTQSMLNKRLTPAAAEINGMIYVVGGFDGVDYLKSMERFDPRENSWSRLESMSTKRGCHSLTVFNDKLYAIGGYNGENMVSTVEVFDPRIGSWMMGESMNTPRGYFSAVVIGNSIFAIGGVNDTGLVLDTVEHYDEAHGWQPTCLKAIGKRCKFSAVPL
ncbi:hypothetical protein Lal_00021998 [Lupinus albus]|nr:hypothetical protein Lal_00021998 [Lupinus albus]